MQTAFTHLVEPSVLLLCEQGRCGFGTKVRVEPLFRRGCSFLADPQQLDLFFPCVSARVLVVLFYVVNSDVIDFISVGRQRSDWPSRTQVLVCSEFSGNAKWCRSAHDRHS